MTDELHSTEDSIAVVGMAGQFPGADSVESFWSMILEGREGVRFFERDELDPSLPQSLTENPDYVRAKGVIDNADCFDAGFFGVTPIEARVMDPQQRLSLQTCWAALEDAGTDASAFDGLVGVYFGSNWNRYRKTNVAGSEEESRFGDFNTSLANEADFLATRIAYKLDLRGPCITVSTACSTSLVAIAEASKALLSFDCDMALAGGVSISTPLNAGYLYQEGSMLSRDGHCRSFDANASGTTFNDGVGAVVLKRTDDALAAGDRIYAVVRGFGVNNDGADKVSFTAPSVEGQAAAISSALAFADIDPATIRMVETHGTATPLGDPIEIAALKRAFGDVGTSPHCAIGSVKSNIGHLVHAAGVAGFIKAVLSVQSGVIPQSLFFEKANEKLGLDESGFFVAGEQVPWPDDQHPRRAGISSFGVGGTNAHVIVEEPPRPSAQEPADEARILCVSAQTRASLDEQLTNLSGCTSREDLSLASIANTLQTGRAAMPQRAAWIAASIGDVDAASLPRGEILRGDARVQRPIGFSFSGQGSQRSSMGLGLKNHDPVFAEVWQRGVTVLKSDCGIDLEAILFDDDERVNETWVAQPALFLFEVAMAKAVMSRGLQPQVVLGHSIGEFAAATIAGVFELEDGLRVVAERGAAMQAQPPGAMLSVFLPPEELEAHLGDELCIAALNAPGSTVISGTFEAIDKLEKNLAAGKTDCRRLKTSHAFHSSMMDPAVDRLAEFLSDVALKPPEIRIVSTATGRDLSDDEACDPAYWSGQLRRPVLFSKAVETVVADGEAVLLEMGPGTALTSLSQMAESAAQIRAYAAAPDASVAGDNQQEALKAVAFAWINGGTVDFSRQWGDSRPPKVSLPTYPFEKTRYWVDAQPKTETSPAVAMLSITQPVVQATAGAPEQGVNQTVMDSADHKSTISQRVISVLEDVSGFDLQDCVDDDAFIDVGFDSIILTQVALALQQEMDVKVTFRELMEDYPTLGELVDYLADQVPAAPVQAAPPAAVAAQAAMPSVDGALPVSGSVQELIDRQLEIMRMQLAVLGGSPAQPAAPTAVAAEPESAATPSAEEIQPRKRGPGTRITRKRDESKELTKAQSAFLKRLTDDYVNATRKSRDYTETHRSYLADPRTVSGFNPLWKSMVYPICTDWSRGSSIRDIDGREYIDITNGFGPIMFGHSPGFVTDAVIEQIQQGIETGPQSPLAGEVAKLCADLTNNERIAFASTGSEAVCCALRLARTVTGRQKIVIFEGAYHGIFDEVVVRPGKNGAGLPAAPGIPREMTENMIVLPYGTDDTLQRIRELAPELAAVMAEPVQSRNPGLQPKEFLQSVREITRESGSALIFDEIVTGFRVAPGGAQEFFGIDADIVSYGKVVGGGHPIGIVGGKARFLDALDGGQWIFDDDSIPEVGVTFFAGTFVRHPVALAAARAVLKHLTESGPSLQQELGQRTTALVDELGEFLDEVSCPVTVRNCTSFFYISIPESETYGGLLFYLLRLKGIHAWEHRPCFLTTAHSEQDLRTIVGAFKQSVGDLIRQGLLAGDAVAVERQEKSLEDQPPVEGARLGKDENGSPAWFIPDPDNPSQYKIVGRKH